jgi:hypothetical protein
MEQWPHIVHGFEAVFSIRRLMLCIPHSLDPQRVGTATPLILPEAEGCAVLSWAKSILHVLNPGTHCQKK